MKKTLLTLLVGCGISFLSAQERADKFTFFSPSYSFSNVNIKSNNEVLYKSQSHGLALNLMRYTFSTDMVEASGGFGFHYLNSKFDDGRNSSNVSYTGLAPELRTQFYPLGKERGIFVGGGAQFFVFPLNSSDEVDVRSFRPMLTMGMSKKYGFTMFLVPTILEGDVGDVSIRKSWYLGLEVDLPFTN
ncbi:MAG: hypothetical protein ACKO7P_00045 [Bacteroidota bacterium]